MKFKYTNCLVRIQKDVISIFPNYSTLRQALCNSPNGYQSGEYLEKCTIEYDGGAYVKIIDISTAKDLVNYTRPVPLGDFYSLEGFSWELSTIKFTTKTSRFGKVTYSAKVETKVDNMNINAKHVYLSTSKYSIYVK